MTPTEQDKELRQKTQDIFNDCTSGWLITIKNFNGYERELGDMESEIIGDILELITADRKRVALEARIDELSAIYGWSQEERTPLIFYPEHRSSDFAQMAANGMGTNFTVRERIAELKQELEKL